MALDRRSAIVARGGPRGRRLDRGGERRAASGERPASEAYAWKNVQMVGGGFVTGIVFHPTAKDVRYCRTDMGGAYRWNAGTKRWEPLLDWLPYEDLNLMGVESLALDPADPDRLYLSCGTYTNPGTPDGAILRSADRGRTFQRANVPFKMGGNENGRGNGERLAVDPNDGRILFLGTRHAGLWRSGDGGATWGRVDCFPDVHEVLPPKPPDEPPWVQRGGSGVVFVVFDPRSGKRGAPSSTLYVGVSLMGRDNLFASRDDGRTWQAVPGHPTAYRPNHAVLASDGTLYVSYGTNPGPWRMSDGGVWKLDTGTGAWTDITPEKPQAGKPFGYAAVAVDARDPRVLIASTFGHPAGRGEDEIFRSTDAGKTWKPVFGGPTPATYDFSLAPYVQVTPIHWLFDIEIDPFDSNHALFTTGYGGYETFNLRDVDTGRPTKWSVMSSGIEETVALDLLSPPRGAHLLTAVGDYSGFVHWDLDRPAPEGSYDQPALRQHDRRRLCRERAGRARARRARVSPPPRRAHRLLARRRPDVAAAARDAPARQPARARRRLIRREHLGLDAGAPGRERHPRPSAWPSTRTTGASSSSARDTRASGGAATGERPGVVSTASRTSTRCCPRSRRTSRRGCSAAAAASCSSSSIRAAGSAARPARRLYVGVSLMGRENLFRSRDGGRTWQPVPGHPTAYRPNHAVLASDGTLYVSYGTNPGPWRMRTAASGSSTRARAPGRTSRRRSPRPGSPSATRRWPWTRATRRSSSRARSATRPAAARTRSSAAPTRGRPGSRCSAGRRQRPTTSRSRPTSR